MTHPSVNSIVERKWTPEQFWEYLEAFLGDWETDSIKDRMDSFGLTVVPATIISELQAEVEAKEVAAKAYYDNYRSEEARALAAESSLSRIKAETIEVAIQFLDRIAPYAMIHFDSRAGVTTLVDHEDHMTVRVFTKTQLLAAIRSLGSTGGAEKTAESGNPAPTRERE